MNQTETRFGLVGTDNGYSFEHAGKLWFLFGDSPPTPTFAGQPNGPGDPPRTPVDNDAIASAPPQWTGDCPKLSFAPNSIGAFTSRLVETAAREIPRDRRAADAADDRPWIRRPANSSWLLLAAVATSAVVGIVPVYGTLIARATRDMDFQPQTHWPERHG